MIDEFRRARRRKVSDTILVTDAMTDTVVGRIGNLSETGMLLIADSPLNDDALYQLRFPLRDRAGKETTLEFGAHQLWQEDAGAPGLHWIGLRFIAIPDDQADRLQQWIDAPGGVFD
jgi:hypothetical protein